MLRAEGDRAGPGSLLGARAEADALIEAVPSGVVLVDEQGLVRRANGIALHLFGYEAHELLGRPVEILVPEGPAERHPDHRERFLRAPTPRLMGAGRDLVARRKDGSCFEVQVGLSPVRTEAGWLVLAAVEDVSARKAAEEALRESESRFRQLAESLPQLVWTCEPNGNCDFLSRQWVEFTGVPAEVQIGYGWLARVHPDDRERLMKEWEASVRGSTAFQMEHRIRRHDGCYRWFDTRALPLRDATGRVVRWFGSNTEIEEQRRMREALRASEERFAKAFQLSPVGNLLMRLADQCVVETNDAFLSITGRTREEVVGRPLCELELITAPEAGQRLAELLVAPAVRGRVEIEFNRADGTEGVALVSAEILELGGETFALGVFDDVTEQKRTARALLRSEEVLRQRQKLEALGTLAGGVAHDFNNLLTVISGNVEFALRQLAGEDPIQQDLEQIQLAAGRAAELTRRLLAFGRRQFLQPQVLDPNEVVLHLRSLLLRLLGADVEVVMELDPELGRVKADQGQLEQVLTNLVANARDAMPLGGRVVVGTANLELEPAEAERLELRPGAYVELRVSDEGCGMDEETRARIFEPFFTTKGSEGSGLGLATVYGIIEQSGGTIQVESRLGQGTTFRIHLPRVRGGASEARDRPSAEPKGRASEVILLVEDEEVVRRVAGRALTASGYRVLQAAGGSEALRLCAEWSGSIDLVLTDVVMPGMNGRELVDRLQAIRPGVPVLYTSGYNEEKIGPHGVLEEGRPFLGKPYTISELTRTVRAVLDAGRSGVA